MNAYQDVMLSAAGLQAGEHTRLVCPACGGGTKHEVSLSLERDETGAVRWHCFRNSCQFSGRRGEVGGSEVVRTTPVRRTTNPYRGELRQLTSREAAVLHNKIGWDERHICVAGARYAPEVDRYAFPIFGPMGMRRGWVLRSYHPEARAKALTRMDVEEPHMSYYHIGSHLPCIVVEDIPSAVRAALYMNSVALNGTGCSPQYANEIAAHYPSVIWALDADATAQSIKLARRHNLLFDSSTTLPLPCDLKDMGEGQLADLLSPFQGVAI